MPGEIRVLARMDDSALNELYKRVFTTDDGRLVLEDLKHRCFEYDTTHTGDDAQIYINEGARQVLLTIKTRLNAQQGEN